jgi:dTDP-4-amino-4,6-dideoxygalactose transaminase
MFENDVKWAKGNSSDESSAFPGWYMEMQELGFNYRLTDFQAALGLSQLLKANKGLQRRREVAKRYEQEFSELSWIYGQSGYMEGHAYHLYIIETEDRLGLYNFLRKHQIFAQVHYVPVHLMPYYRKQGFNVGDFPNAEKYYSRCLSLPMYPLLTAQEQDYVVNTVKDYFR